MTNIVLKYEHRMHQKRHGAIKLLSRAEADMKSGFRSIFGLGPDAVKQIELQGNGTNLGQFPLFCDNLILDFDNNEAAENRAEKKFVDRGFAYTKYFTGNRGHHFHIKIKPLYKVGLAPMFRAFTETHFPGVDSGVYKPLGMIRIPGTRHSKTGKRMIKVTEAGSLTMDMEAMMPKGFAPTLETEYDPANLELRMMGLLTRTVHEGKRHTIGWSIAKLAKELDIERPWITKRLEDWNTSFCTPPMGDSELYGIIRRTYESR